MRREDFENKIGVLGNSYQRYLKLGGIINEKDCQNALDRMRSVPDRKEPSVRASISQAIEIAKYAGIELNGSENNPDQRVGLYVLLRLDVRPEGVEHHHSQMSDQRIFMEALRILGDVESVDKMIKAYPNISFKYEREK